MSRYDYEFRFVVPASTTTQQPKLQMRRQFVSDRIGGPTTPEAKWVDVPTVVDSSAFSGPKVTAATPTLDSASALLELEGSLHAAAKPGTGAPKVMDHTITSAVTPMSVWRKMRQTEPRYPDVRVMALAQSHDEVYVVYQPLQPSHGSLFPKVSLLSQWLTEWVEIMPKEADIQVNTHWILRSTAVDLFPDFIAQSTMICVTGRGTSEVQGFVLGPNSLPESIRRIPSFQGLRGALVEHFSLSTSDFLRLFLPSPYRWHQ